MTRRGCGGLSRLLLGRHALYGETTFFQCQCTGIAITQAILDQLPCPSLPSSPRYWTLRSSTPYLVTILGVIECWNFESLQPCSLLLSRLVLPLFPSPFPVPSRLFSPNLYLYNSAAGTASSRPRIPLHFYRENHYIFNFDTVPLKPDPPWLLLQTVMSYLIRELSSAGRPLHPLTLVCVQHQTNQL